jgi:hypothetical protein
LMEALARCHASGDWSEPWEHAVHEMEIKRW